ncbi:hypothetical protein PQU63_20480 [Xanthomonas protegens]|uniref:Restriction endonuclease type IV Mrr domain-containing protein n=1 Tax=Xanthomonas protegens TaxID=3380705 RepID=A0ABU9LIF9_9XANT
MTEISIVDSYLSEALPWITGRSTVDIRFLARRVAEGGYQTLAVHFDVIPSPQDDNDAFNFSLDMGDVWLGQWRDSGVDSSVAIQLLKGAAKGVVEVYGRKIFIPSDFSPVFSRFQGESEWYVGGLGFLMQGSCAAHEVQDFNLALLDNELRRASPPFDGIEDALHWLGLKEDFGFSTFGRLRVRVAPPADLLLNETFIENGVLSLAIVVHPQCDVATLSVAVRGAPGVGVSSRLQIAGEIIWEAPGEVRRIGRARVELPQADSVLIMLSVGTHYVRRHWFVDPVRSSNERLLAVRLFDGDLKMLKRYLLGAQNQEKFELAVAELLFLSGFSSAIQCETDASDIVVFTPGGRVALVECTLRVSDFSAKIGKLVHRREALVQALSKDGRVGQVLSVIVCHASRAQIAPTDAELARRGVLVVARESLERHIDSLHFPVDADKIYVECQEEISRLLS